MFQHYLFFVIKEHVFTFPSSRTKKLPETFLPIEIFSISKETKTRKQTNKYTTGWRVQGSKPGRKSILGTSPYQPWGPTSLLYHGYVSFLGVKEPQCGVKHTTPSSTEVEGSRVIPVLPLWAFMSCYRVNLMSYLFFDFFLILFLTINTLCIILPNIYEQQFYFCSFCVTSHLIVEQTT